MAKQKFGLGRGLDALISGASDIMSAQQHSRIDEHNITEVAIDKIIPNPRQPRKVFREDDPKLLELSASIKEYGLLQPLIVTRLDTLDTEQHGREGIERRSASSAQGPCCKKTCCRSTANSVQNTVARLAE